MLQEMFQQIQALEKKLDFFIEYLAEDRDRWKFYPLKAKISDLYCKLAVALETRSPKECIWCYWQAYLLTQHEVAVLRLFERNKPTQTVFTDEPIPSGLVESASKRAYFLEGFQYFAEIGKEQSDQKALETWQDLAYKRDPEACYMTGYLYMHVLHHEKMAFDFFSLATSFDFGLGYHELAAWSLTYKKTDEGNSSVVRLLKMSADCGNVISQFNLALTYLSGKDALPEKAFYYLDLAALQGFLHAYNKKGLVFENGMVGVAVDEGRALECYRLAARGGEEDAQKNLQRMYQRKVVPLEISQIKQFIEDKMCSHELKEVVETYLKQMHQGHPKNFELAYCAFRVICPDTCLEQLLKEFPCDLVFDFILSSDEVSPEEKHKDIIDILRFSKVEGVRKKRILTYLLNDAICTYLENKSTQKIGECLRYGGEDARNIFLEIVSSTDRCKLLGDAFKTRFDGLGGSDFMMDVASSPTGSEASSCQSTEMISRSSGSSPPMNLSEMVWATTFGAGSSAVPEAPSSGFSVGTHHGRRGLRILTHNL